MKNKTILSILSVLLALSFVVNSCKKDNQQPLIQALFNNSTWQLASVERIDKLGSSTLHDTTYTPCDLQQYFTFAGNGTCTYTNYHCITQNKTGNWSLFNKGLYLDANIALMDTVSADSCCTVTHPFQNSDIYNVGNYSLVLRVGDIAAYYTSNQKRTIYFYGFVRVTSTNK